MTAYSKKTWWNRAQGSISRREHLEATSFSDEVLHKKIYRRLSLASRFRFGSLALRGCALLAEEV